MKLIRIEKDNYLIKMNILIFAIICIIIITTSCAIMLPQKGVITNYTGEDNNNFYWEYDWYCSAEKGSFSGYTSSSNCGIKTGERLLRNNGTYMIPGAFFVVSPFKLNSRVNGHATFYNKNSKQGILSFSGIKRDLLFQKSDLYKSEIKITWKPEILADIEDVLNEFQIKFSDVSAINLNYKYSLEIENDLITLAENNIQDLQNKLNGENLIIEEYLSLPTGYDKRIFVDITITLNAENESLRIFDKIFEKQYSLSKEEYIKSKKSIYIGAPQMNLFTKQALNYIGVYEFKKAINKNDIEWVEKLLSKYIIEGIKGESLLDIAIDRRRYEIARFLIKKGITSINCNPEDGTTSIHKLLKNFDHLDINNTRDVEEIASVKELLNTIPLTEECLNLDKDVSFKPLHPILYAIRNNLWDFVERALKHGANPNFLEMAATKGNIRIYELLLEYGADFSKASEKSLCYAAGNGHYDLVKYLLDKKAEVSGKTLESACKSGNYLIATLIFDTYKKQYIDFTKQLTDLKLLEIAIENKADEKIIQYLIDSGSSIHEDNITTAVIYGNFDAIKVLLENSPKPVDDDFIYHAIGNGNIKNLNYLINKGFNINKAYYSNVNPIFRAAEDGRIDLVNILLNNNAEMYISDRDSWNLLSTILLNAKTEKSYFTDKQMLFTRDEIIYTLRLAQEKGAKLNWNNHFFKSPHSEKAIMLLESIENINEYPKDEWLPVLNVAAKDGAVSFLELFIKNGIKLSDPIDGSQTLRQVLEKHNHQEIIQVLTK